MPVPTCPTFKFTCRHKFGPIALALAFTLAMICGLPAYGQQSSVSFNTASGLTRGFLAASTPTPRPSSSPEMAGMSAKKTTLRDSDTMEEELPHGFFTHEGLPDEVGSFSLRTSALAMRIDGETKGDFAFHLETGLTKRIGLHIRNDRFLNLTRSEAMFQFAVIKSKNGKSGFAPIIEFEFPTRTGGGSRINTLVGFTTKFSNERAAFNSVVHYNPREDMVESSASFVFKAGSRYYPVMEVLTEFARAEGPIINLVGGLKVRVSQNWIIGFGVQAPVTTREDFSSQLIFQSENMLVWKR